MTTLSIELPYPPSANSYWRHPGRGPLAGRHLISQEGREYRRAVGAAVGLVRGRQGLTERLVVMVEANPPDRRRRDLDNLLKPLLDSLMHAGVYEDDSQIDDLRIMRGPVTRGGRVLVTVTAHAATDWRTAMGEDAA